MEFIKILFNIAFTVLLITRCCIVTAVAEIETEIANEETVVETTTKSATAAAVVVAGAAATAAISYKNNTAAVAAAATLHIKQEHIIIDNSIDFQADPCEDFYQYACGEWKQNLQQQQQQQQQQKVLPEDDYANDDILKAATNDDGVGDDDDNIYMYDRTLGLIDFLADKEVLKYFNARNSTTSSTTNTTTTSETNTIKNSSTKEPDFVIKVYKYYKSCIAIEQYEPIKYLEWLEVNEHIKWPSLINTTTQVEQDQGANQDGLLQQQHEKEDEYKLEDDWEEVIHEMEEQQEELQRKNFSWIRTLAILRKYGLNGIFIEEIIYTKKTYPTKLIIGFDKPVKDGGFKSLKKDNLKTIISSLHLPNITEESFNNLWLDITKFEWKLIKLNDIEDSQGAEILTMDQFPLKWFKTYLTVALNHTDLEDNMKFVVTNSAYMLALDELLNEYDDYFLNKYLKIRFLWHLYKQEPYKFKPLECIVHIKHFIPLAFDWIFEQQRSELKEEIPKIQNIYENLRKQFNLTLYKNRNNFDSSLLEYFVTKLENIQLKVGTFPKTLDSQFFYNNRKFYSKLKLSSREFYQNHLKILYFNFATIHSFSSDSFYIDIKEYENGLNSAPYFNSRLNTINIPLSVLQPPIYLTSSTDIYKYSTLGFLLAQTLMYGFNLNGLALDETGKIRQNYKCLGDIDSAEVDDKISTVSGFRLSYQTFFHSNTNNLISNRKLFFLNFAQTFCASSLAPDDLGRNHVNHALAQFSEFSKIFECSTDSHMNPYEKCYLWD